jgi:hypothetical protein
MIDTTPVHQPIQMKRSYLTGMEFEAIRPEIRSVVPGIPVSLQICNEMHCMHFDAPSGFENSQSTVFKTQQPLVS